MIGPEGIARTLSTKNQRRHARPRKQDAVALPGGSNPIGADNEARLSSRIVSAGREDRDKTMASRLAASLTGAAAGVALAAVRAWLVNPPDAVVNFVAYFVGFSIPWALIGAAIGFFFGKKKAPPMSGQRPRL